MNGVVRRQPLDKSNKGGPAIEEAIPPGAYLCRHPICIPKPGFGYVVVEPYNSEPFDNEVSEELQKSIKLAASNPKEKIVVTVPTCVALQQGKRTWTEDIAKSHRKIQELHQTHPAISQKLHQ
jgi:hypothetical protein